MVLGGMAGNDLREDTVGQVGHGNDILHLLYLCMALLGWLNEACICHANFLQSGTPSNANKLLSTSWGSQ